MTFSVGANSPYIVGVATSDRSLEESQRLRYTVFHEELGEGLQTNATAGLDRDPFDDQMTHLLIIARESGRVVGTYRVQSVRHALESPQGIYTACQYDMSAFEPYYDKALELGRACLAKDHRSLKAIVLLWLGIGEFMNLYGLHYLFGCSSITSQDPEDGWRAMKTIRQQGFLHPELMLPVLPSHSCGPPSREFDEDLGDAIRLPKLFRTYVHLGARVISEPAIDRDFGTVDFVVLMDGREVQLSRLDVLR